MNKNRLKENEKYNKPIDRPFLRFNWSDDCKKLPKVKIELNQKNKN